MTGNFNPALSRGIREHYLYENQQMRDYVGEFFQEEDMDGAYDDEVTWEGMGTPQEHFPLSPVTYDGIQPSFTVRYLARSWTLGVVIPIEDQQDDLYGIYHKFLPMVGGEWARSYQLLDQILGSQFFGLYGFQSGTSVPFSPDGLSFFNTSHPVSLTNPTTWSNRPSTDADLSTAMIWMADSAMRTQPRPNGLAALDNRLAKLMVHPSWRIPALQLLNTGIGTPGTANRDTNQYVADLDVKVVANPYWTYSGTNGALASPVDYNAWFFQGTHHYCKWKKRADLDIYDQFNPTIFGTILTAMKRFCYGLTDVRGLYGSQGG